MYYKEIFQLEDGQQNYTSVPQQQYKKPAIPMQSTPVNEQSNQIDSTVTRSEHPQNARPSQQENIIKMVNQTNKQDQNDSFSNIPQLKPGGSPKQMPNFYDDV